MKLYSTGCPKCMVLEAKLKQKGIQYEICDTVEEMEKLGFTSVPMLVTDNGVTYDFSSAVQWINKM